MTEPAADDFQPWLDRAWDEHAADPRAVLQRLLAQGSARAAADPEVAALARLAAHLHGTHLGLWAEGRAFQAELAAHPCAGPAARDAAALHDAALALAAAGAGADGPAAGAGTDGGTDGSTDGAAASVAGAAGAAGAPGAAGSAPLPPATRVRALALAADHLHAHDAGAAAARLQQAQALAAALPLAGDDPACRALAVAGNNIAAALEELPQRSAAQRALMLQAAHCGRRWWARAGTWLQVERAEYRLAMSHLAAGDPAAARAHAQACLEGVRANGDAALERFFGLQALALAERALGDAAAQAAAVAAAAAAFAALDEADQGWCRPALQALQG